MQVNKPIRKQEEPASAWSNFAAKSQAKTAYGAYQTDRLTDWLTDRTHAQNSPNTQQRVGLLNIVMLVGIQYAEL